MVVCVSSYIARGDSERTDWGRRRNRYRPLCQRANVGAALTQRLSPLIENLEIFVVRINSAVIAPWWFRGQCRVWPGV